MRSSAETRSSIPLAMARAALSVVFSQGRDDELAALRARVAELERSREDLCWQDRVQQVKHVCEHITNRESILDHVYELLAWPIEQQRWGIREDVVAMDGIGYESGRLSFNRYEDDFGYDLERTVMEVLADAVMNGSLQSVKRYMRDVEAELSLPPGSLARLPADADFR